MHIKIFGLFSFGNCPASSLPASAQAMLKVRKGSDETRKLRNMKPEVVDEIWRCFNAALEPIRDQGKLGLVMSQFTTSFVPSAENFLHLQGICERIAPTRLAAEFRNPSWAVSAEASDLLRSLGVVCVHSDDNGSYNQNNNFRQIVRGLRGKDIGYCRIHRRPTSSQTGLTCENVTREDIERSMQVDPATGLSKGDLRSEEIREWSGLLQEAASVMSSGARIYVLFSTIGRNASADNAEKMRVALGDFAGLWPRAVGHIDSSAIENTATVNTRHPEHKCAEVESVEIDLSVACCETSAECHIHEHCASGPKSSQEVVQKLLTLSESGQSYSEVVAESSQPPRRNRWGKVRS